MTTALRTPPILDAPGPRPPATIGLLFSAPMVRALLWSPTPLKTETRRLPNYSNTEPQWYNGERQAHDREAWEALDIASARPSAGGARLVLQFKKGPPIAARFYYPRVRPGDRIYVKETWAPSARFNGRPVASIPDAAVLWYRADAEQREHRGWKRGKWRSSMFMPKRAARIWLTVTSVEVQRLQDITIADAMAEGIPPFAGEATALGIFDNATTPGHEYDNRTTRENYARLWDTINGTGSWNRNPIVFVYRFTVEVRR